jgi:hypothetical protein
VSARRLSRERDDRATRALAEASPRICTALGFDRERKRIAEVVLWAMCRLPSQSVTLSTTRRREFANLLDVGEGWLVRAIDDLEDLGFVGALRIDRRLVAAWAVGQERQVP